MLSLSYIQFISQNIIPSPKSSRSSSNAGPEPTNQINPTTTTTPSPIDTTNISNRNSSSAPPIDADTNTLYGWFPADLVESITKDIQDKQKQTDDSNKPNNNGEDNNTNKTENGAVYNKADRKQQRGKTRTFYVSTLLSDNIIPPSGNHILSSIFIILE